MLRWLIGLCVASGISGLVTAQRVADLDMVREWAEGWAGIEGARWVWEYRVRGGDRVTLLRDDTAYVWPSHLVRRVMRQQPESIPPSDEGWAVSQHYGFTADGRFFAIDDSGGFQFGAVMPTEDKLLHERKRTPSVLASAIMNGTVAIDPADVELKLGVTIWRPSALPGQEYRFERHEHQVLLMGIDTYHDNELVQLATERVFRYDTDAMRSPAVPSSAIRVSHLSPDITFPGLPDGGKSLPRRTEIESRLIGFEVLTKQDAPVLDVTGRTQWIPATGEIIDTEGRVVNRVIPEKKTGAAFQWSAMIAVASVGCLVAALGIWWIRRARA